MKPIFDPMELELTTPGEREIFERYVKEVLGYMDGKVDGVKIRQETSACAVIAKKIQSRSAMAVIKYDMQKRTGEAHPVLEDRREEK